MADVTQVIKKRVIRGQSTTHTPAELYLNEHDGEMWATNRYWVTRAERVAPLLEKYNLSAAEPAAFAVNGSVRPADRQPPSLDMFFGTEKNYSPAVRVHVAGQPVFAEGGTGIMMALYALEDGSHAGLIAEELGWLSDQMTSPLAEGLRYGVTRVLFRKTSSGHVSARVEAGIERVVTPAHYTEKVEGEAQEYVREVREPAGTRLLGVMMGLSYGDKS